MIKTKKIVDIQHSKWVVSISVLLSLSACGGGGSSNGNDTSSINGASAPIAASAPTNSNSPTNQTTPVEPTIPASSTSPTSSPSDTSPNNSTSNPSNSTGSGNNSTNPSNSTLSLNCSLNTKVSAASSSSLIVADTPSSDGTRLFQLGSTFNLSLTTQTPKPDTLNWTIIDTLGKSVASGSFSVPSSPTTTNLNCTSTLAGYFAVNATLSQSGGALPTQGTRPSGIATFGVIPNVTSFLPTPTYSKQEQHRFGMQGFNDYNAMLIDLGISSTIDDRQLSTMEPTQANTFNPQADNLDPNYKDGKIMSLVRLDGIPAWASSTGAMQDDTNLPNDLNYYQNYMSRVGTETEKIRAQYYPTQTQNFYQVTWEPNWQDTDSNFVNLYKYVYNGLHSTDSNAIVMGPADPFPSLTTSRLQRLASLGFKNYIDGVATHGYYDAGTSPSHPPERLQTDSNPANAANSLMNQMKALRQEMQADYKPNMKLFVTETGISYDLGSSYGPNYPSANILYAQAAVTARTHIILLGEGASQTYIFYGADYPGETGYGTFFDLNDSQGAFGASNISPKPSALAVAAMTHILDGTVTLGSLNNMPTGLYAYSFQQLGGGKIITALWTHNNSVWDASVGFSSTYSVPYQLQVDSVGTSGTVSVIDMMGNVSSLNYTNGLVNLNLTESPIYIVSNNANIAKANATVPIGYLGN